MARPLTDAERVLLAEEAFELSARGWSQTAISERLGVSRSTTQRLLEKQRLERWRHRSKDSVDGTLTGIEQAIREVWRRLESLPPTSASPASAGLLNSLHNLFRLRCDILGWRAPTRTESKVRHSHQGPPVGWGDRLTPEELDTLARLCQKAEPGGALSAEGENGFVLGNFPTEN